MIYDIYVNVVGWAEVNGSWESFYQIQVHMLDMLD